MGNIMNKKRDIGLVFFSERRVLRFVVPDEQQVKAGNMSYCVTGKMVRK
jgi:hypothetical protein